MGTSKIFIFLLSITLLLFTFCTRRQYKREINGNNSYRNAPIDEISTQQGRTRGNSSVKMHRENGVYYVPCKINGTEMKFIFDTGASDITMSSTEAIYLYKQGKLSDEDFIGTQKYQIADGSIQEGTVVTLRTVEIGNRTIKNVRASIIHNFEAPLLLGQSALSKFGKISINYKKNEISFE